MGFVWFLLAVVVLGAAAYFAITVTTHRQEKEIEKITIKKQKMMSVPIADTLYTLKNLNLTGQTKRTYESWQATWQTVTRFRFPEIEGALISAEEANHKLNFIKANQFLKKADEMIDEVKKDVDKIFDALQKLIDSEKQNRAELEILQERYNTMRKELLAHSFSYGEALETLEKRLSYLELDFTKFNSLTNEGDHMEAKEVLSHIKVDMNELEEIISEVPNYFKEIAEEHVEQLEDLKQGYQKLQAEKYIFPKVDVEREIQSIQTSIDKSREFVHTTELAEARKQMDKTAREIEQLYDLMESEVEAKNFVNGHKSQIMGRMEEALQNNRYVMIEIDRISQTYILNNNELAQASDFAERLEKEKESIAYYNKALSDHTAPYSVIKEHYELVAESLEEIDQKQKNLVANLSDLRQQEKSIRDNLDTYELDLRNMKRTIEKHHLPGLPKSYLELFFATGARIEQLSQKLNRVKIDMKEINSLNSMLEEDMESLDIQTEEIIDHSQLTEYMIQRANRYRVSNPDIEQAITQSLQVFNQTYRYDESLSIIEQALEQVEAGSGQRVRDDYAKEKQNPFF